MKEEKKEGMISLEKGKSERRMKFKENLSKITFTR
jgi:hypothetical protein